MTTPTKWLCAQWVVNDPNFLHVDSDDSDQTGRMPKLIWVFVGRTLTLLVLSRLIPINNFPTNEQHCSQYFSPISLAPGSCTFCPFTCFLLTSLFRSHYFQSALTYYLADCIVIVNRITRDLSLMCRSLANLSELIYQTVPDSEETIRPLYCILHFKDWKQQRSPKVFSESLLFYIARRRVGGDCSVRGLV